MRRSRRSKKKNRVEMILVISGLIILIGVAAFGTVRLRAKCDANEARMQELMAEIEEEERRTGEIEELEKEMQTKKFVEEFAKKFLNLVYPDEILFKAK